MVAIEDLVTGDISCEQDGLKVDNCNSKSVKGANQLFVRLIFTSDFTFTTLRKNLILKNAGFIQRFPVNLEVDPKAILIANQFSNFSPVTLGLGSGDSFSLKIPAMRSMIVIITIIITF